jgi:hypothetical protein
MRVDRNANGVELDITWDVTTCTAVDYFLVMGDLAAVSSLPITDVACGLGTSGTATITPPPGDLYLLLGSVNAAGVESSHGLDGSGSHRVSTAVPFCAITSQSLAGTCP